jgi:hypothetical protein
MRHAAASCSTRRVTCGSTPPDGSARPPSGHPAGEDGQRRQAADAQPGADQPAALHTTAPAPSSKEGVGLLP